ncbi:MAG: hypothetical protein AAF750_00325 [Planctomycetota bacterium]
MPANLPVQRASDGSVRVVGRPICTPLLSIMALLWGMSAGSANAEPAGGHRVEAESPKPPSDSRVVEIEDGRAVTSDRDWEPVVVTDRLGDWTGRAKVWIRHAGGPVNLKAKVDGKQQELAWVWATPKEMTWSSFGVFERDSLGSGIVVIRGNKGPVTVDAVVFEPVKAEGGAQAAPAEIPTGPQPAAARGTDLPPEQPDATAPAIDVSLFIEWSRPIGPITADHWAVNDYSVVKPDLAGQPEFNAYMRELTPSIVRIHWAEKMERWTDASTRTWDAEAMKANLDAAKGLHGTKLMFNINWWPKWLHDGSVLPAEKEAEFVRLCSELPGVMRRIGHPVSMIEVINEREGHYEKAGKLPQLWSLYARCAEAIRDADSEVLVGGPALTWPKPQWVESFIAHDGLSYSDFFTWHNYASGHATDDNASVFAAADRLGKHAADTMQALADAGYPDMPGYLTEYNVSWTWTTRDRRMGNSIGAVFQALTVKHLAEAGATGAFVWHIQDNIYGLLAKDGSKRAPAELFLWHEHLAGEMHAVASERPDAVEALAVRHANGGRALLLMVKAGQTVRLHPNDTLKADAPWTTVRSIVPAGSPTPVWTPGQPVELPGYSLLLLSTAD